MSRLKGLNATLARMTLAEAVTLRHASAQGNVEAVTLVFERYEVPEAFLTAVAYVVAKQEAARLRREAVKSDADEV
jgi:hypothetical protein